ncbi:6-aminopenicillanic acid acyl-transferase [Actinomadura soli]|uniref:6-aminopenicillanic acid acyl-transferase n=1 Tax=Actinomadura soli TaxID=2508997 RepID=A0A5C4JGG1_9ACTN|nr:C45 family peptidase [Actinomadura soli]TMR04916.1 6-aminopenicillanic acid acyl-transferase [Actinomadura soli]
MSATPEDSVAESPRGPELFAPSEHDLYRGRLIDVSGDGPARGTVHGEALRDLIAEGLDRWRQDLGERTGRSPKAFMREFLDSTGFVRTVSTLSPDLYEEVLAIAVASNQPKEDLLVYNMMDEQWRFRDDPSTGCSVIGTLVRHNSTYVQGQNMDLPVSMDTSQAMLRIAGDDHQPQQLIMTAAGMIGLFGLNVNGLACCVNTLAMLPSASTGMPVAFIVRQLLKHGDASSAASYLMSVPHASGQHYALADRQGLRSYECSAQGCTAGPPDDKVLHTNHPLWQGEESRTGDQTEGRRHSPTTYARLRVLTDRLDEVRESGHLETLLSSSANGLCVRPTPERATATFCSAEFTLTSPPAVRVALGRPDRTAWRPVGWTARAATPD